MSIHAAAPLLTRAGLDTGLLFNSPLEFRFPRGHIGPLAELYERVLPRRLVKFSLGLDYSGPVM